MTHTSSDARDDTPTVPCQVVRNDFPAGHEISLIVDDCPRCHGQHVHPGGLEDRPLYGRRSAPCCGFRRECGYQLAPAPDGGAA